MVETKAVKMVLVRQIDQVLSEKMPALGMIEVDHGTPSCVPIKETLPSKRPKDVVCRPRVIEDNIHQDSQSIPVTCVH